MVLLIPVNAVISAKMKKFQRANMGFKDKRIKAMNEILDGIKVIKLSAWEPSFLQQIADIRDVEVETLKKRSYLGAFQTFLFNSAPFMVALASFATYVFSDSNKLVILCPLQAKVFQPKPFHFNSNSCEFIFSLIAPSFW